MTFNRASIALSAQDAIAIFQVEIEFEGWQMQA